MRQRWSVIGVLSCFFLTSILTTGVVDIFAPFRSTPLPTSQPSTSTSGNTVHSNGQPSFDVSKLKYYHHIYDNELLNKRNNSKCAPLYEEKVQFHKMNMGHWIIHTAKEKEQERGYPYREINNNYYPVLFGTETTQRVIYERLHPKDCSKAKFALLGLAIWGTGSCWHQFTASIGVALDLGRIPIFPDAEKWRAGSYCENQTTWECFFEPLSSCAPPPNFDLHNVPLWDGRYVNHPEKVIEVHSRETATILPNIFRSIMECSPVPPGIYSYWWRIQGITYVVRPNKRTVEALKVLRAKHFSGPDVLPQGTISMHVRHGDKHKEMKLFELPTFMSAAEDMISTHKPLIQNSIFISTEDPSVIDDSKQFSKFTFYYSNELRKNAEINELGKIGAERVLLDLLNLELALEADGQISTFGSNWNRVIDELKATVGFCAGCPFMDVSQCYSVEDCKKKGSWFKVYW